MSKLIIKDNVFSTELAISGQEQAKGLMWVEWPPPVMCFPYKGAGYRKFWMKNTISPLDIVFCCNKRIIGIYKGEPMSTALVGPDSVSDLVIELPFGTVKKMGIKVGDEINLTYSENDMARLIKEGM